ncbi:FAD-dependent oxidoreductase [Paenibacillus koleovorans]|uniref:FAD-dependent oxidoreductase n=1 Tax=Paenibacillus koleovorans TaxID=121608 RepID=UPI000FDB1D4E|nr:FAD-dependent oxidoreductase [Paenibacillus koleovorans]
MSEALFRLQRDIPVEQGYDLVVAGGGPAGVAAAVCAARLGIRVLLVEATGTMGGMGTSGLVTAFDPMANGERMLVGGLMKEIVETMYMRGYMSPGIDPNCWRKDFHKWSPFRVEGYKRVLDDIVVQAGVEVRFFTRLIDVHVDSGNRKVHGVVIHNIEGYRYISAKTFVDSTGDAVLADLCGATCREAGRDTQHIMPATLPSLFTNIDWEKKSAVVEQKGVEVRQAIQDGHFTQPDPFLVGMSKVGDNVGYLNGGHLFNLNALRVRDLTDGIMFGRKIAEEYLHFYRKYIPGCENLEHVTTASLIGVRESRRVVGEYELGIDDYTAKREFPDQIGVFNKFVDVHPYDCSEEAYRIHLEEKSKRYLLKPGEYFGIPYGVLVPRGWDNLWVAGRCASSDVLVHGSIRVQPACSMMGQAAGTAAAQSIRTGRPAYELDTEELVHTLREADAFLPQVRLSRSMTRQ